MFLLTEKQDSSSLTNLYMILKYCSRLQIALCQQSKESKKRDLSTDLYAVTILFFWICIRILLFQLLSIFHSDIGTILLITDCMPFIL